MEFHTSRPWKAVNAGTHWNNPDLINWQIHWSDDGECVADTVYLEEDAHLIAAAPELLDALKDFISRTTLSHEHEFSELIAVGREAIAKAEGRS